MADWFKFYENDLDETRFQYAIHKLQEVCAVWVGILSECCRHKSDTVRWGTNEIELFGFSQRLNISVPKVNEAIKLLCEIDYIEKDNNHIKVLKWSKKQSDYCQKKAAKCPDSVGTVSEQCRDSVCLEERRGEEMSTPISRPGVLVETELPVGFPRTEEEAVNKCPIFLQEKKEFVLRTFHKAMGRGGRDAKDIPIRNWVSFLRTELGYEEERKRSPLKGRYADNSQYNKPNPRNAGLGIDEEAQGKAIAETIARRNREEQQRKASANAVAKQVDQTGLPLPEDT